MVKDGNFYYIDYQGGRLGNAYYDLASLLYSGKTVIDENRRERLLNYYLKITHLNIESFYFVALFRIMQAMGSYGFRGFFERKARFLKSIPNACRNVESILKKQRSYENDVKSIAEKYPEIFHCFIQIIEYGKSLENKIKPKSNLTVEINSFSYRFGIPNDDSGNGGGFVFDCRSLQNPGRYDLYKDKNSRDHQEVRSFLQGQPAITEFLDNVWNIVKPAVQNYVDRNFAHLQISFGCTGGQHRSVYCAEKIAKKLREEFDITLKVEHLQL
jgi:RNase adaptor protein for sRNA GlmZ degradation